jgi:hypothetical protein
MKISLHCFVVVFALAACGAPLEPDTPTPALTASLMTGSPPAQSIPTVIVTTPDANLPAPDPSATFAVHACQPEARILDGHFLLGRPIGPEDTFTVDKVYRYGHTLNGARDPHTGVEFANGAGTPVLAAEAGVVAFAGADDVGGLAPWPYFYGNTVVIQHRLGGVDQPVYTLYAHLSQVQVEAGASVSRGAVIGAVGATGVAIGNHLHFEVRVGSNEYTAVQNPELWLEPLPDGASGALNGALAGYVLDASGAPGRVSNLVITQLANGARVYFEGYQGKIEGDALWGERFGIGGLPPGEVELAFTFGRLFKKTVQIEPGKVTLVAFCVSD